MNIDAPKNTDVLLSIYMLIDKENSYIQEAIESILNQNTKYTFCLYIIDNSASNSLSELIDKYKAEHPDKIEHIQVSKEVEQADTILMTYKNIQSPYFCFLLPNDYYTDLKFFQRALQTLESQADVHIYATNTEIIEINSEKYPLFTRKSEKIDIKAYAMYDDAHWHTSSCIYRSIAVQNSVFDNLHHTLEKKYISLLTSSLLAFIFSMQEGSLYYVNQVSCAHRTLLDKSDGATQTIEGLLKKTDISFFLLNCLAGTKIELLLHYIIHNCTDQIVKKLHLVTKEEQTHYKNELNKIIARSKNYIESSKGKIDPLQYTLLNTLIQECAYTHVHVMHNDKFLADFVTFLNTHFDSEKHLVLCVNNLPFEFPKGDNVFLIDDPMAINLSSSNIKQVIWHGLFVGDFIRYLYMHHDVLAKSYWKIWGGDLYNAPRDEINDFVRSNFKGYAVGIDRKVLAERYPKASKNYFRTPYLNGGTSDDLEKLQREEGDELRIQINNSCDASTLEILLILAKFKEENIKIRTILSYGMMQCKDAIIAKGKEIFKEKFEVIDTHMPIQDYFQYLANNDILILNQNRQQGFGNTLASLFLGKKVYMRSDVTTFDFLQQENVVVFDSLTLKNASFQDLKSYSKKQKEHNQKEVKTRFYDETILKSQWEQLFDTILNKVKN